MQDAVASPASKRRRPWLAGLANLFAAPLGHVYVGRPLRGLGLGVAALVCGTGALVGSLYARGPLSIVFLVAPLCVPLVMSADAVVLARRATSYRLRWFNRWYVYLGAGILLMLLSQGLASALRRHVVQAYKVPAGAMVPTLLIGDHFLTDKLAYRLGVPRRFDVVVFDDPKEPARTFVKRVIGLPGDTIEIQDAQLRLNGSPIEERYASWTGPARPENSSGKWRVPPGQYFVLGDFRNASFDSRHFGAISGDKIWGRVQRIYWSWDAPRHAVRWDRIGMSVE